MSDIMAKREIPQVRWTICDSSSCDTFAASVGRVCFSLSYATNRPIRRCLFAIRIFSRGSTARSLVRACTTAHSWVFLRWYFSGRIQIFLELLIIAMSSVFRIQHICLFCKNPSFTSLTSSFLQLNLFLLIEYLAPFIFPLFFSMLERKERMTW